MPDDRISRRLLTAGPLLLALSLTVGCSGGAAPPSDPDKAGQVLRQVLDAWKEGKPPASLQQASPAVTVGDWQWERGTKLTEYAIDGTGTPAGSDIQFRVKLSVTDPKGKKAQEQAVYTVSTTPKIVVVRGEPGL